MPPVPHDTAFNDCLLFVFNGTCWWQVATQQHRGRGDPSVRRYFVVCYEHDASGSKVWPAVYSERNGHGVAGLTESETACSLRDNNIGSEGATLLADALGTNETITKLDIAGNNIGDEGAQAIFEMLTTMPSIIRHLDVSNNNLTYRAGVSAGTMLRTNECVEELCFNYNSLVRPTYAGGCTVTRTPPHVTRHGCQGTAGLISIVVGARANLHLRVLQMVKNGITVKGVDTILDTMHANRVIEVIMYVQAWCVGGCESRCSREPSTGCSTTPS